MQLGALDVGYVAVDRGRMDEHRRRREPIIVGLEVDRLLATVRDVGEKSTKALEHAFAPCRLNGVTWHAVFAKSIPEISIQRSAGSISAVLITDC